jgi:cell division protease FtsH
MAEKRGRRILPGRPRALGVLFVALVVVVAVLVWSLLALSPRTSGQQVSYDQLSKLIATRKISTATIDDQDSRVVFSTTDHKPLWTAYQSGTEGAAIATALVNNGATVTIDQQWGKRTLALFAEFILPLLLLANLFGIFIMLVRGGANQVKDLFAFSRIGARRAIRESNPYRFSDVGAAGEAIEELAEVRDYLTDPTRFAAMGALPPKGVLLYGPPGCGKTLLAKALAGEAGVPFYFISGSEFVESLVGVGAARMRDLFRQAMATAPAIVFVDELDAAGRKRGAGVGGGHDEREQTLNEMLVQMDGFSPSLGVVVIGATNRPDILDPALLRPGRFDRHVAIEPPDARGRLEILRLHAATRRLDATGDLQGVARATPGFTGADLANVINEGALLAVRRRAAAISGSDLDEAVQRVIAGPKRRGRLLTPDEVERIAYHEAGHVVVASAVEFPADVRRVSIVARGRNAAHADVLPRSDRTVLTRRELTAEMAIAMAGVAAEELRTGEPSTAAEADIERATDMARRFAGRYGMSPRVGRIRVIQKDTEVFLGRDYMLAQNLSSRTLETVDEAVRELVDDAEQEALSILQKHRDTLDVVAVRLMEQETLEEQELNDILAAVDADAASATGPA